MKALTIAALAPLILGLLRSVIEALPSVIEGIIMIISYEGISKPLASLPDIEDYNLTA